MENQLSLLGRKSLFCLYYAPDQYVLWKLPVSHPALLGCQGNHSVNTLVLSATRGAE